MIGFFAILILLTVLAGTTVLAGVGACLRTDLDPSAGLWTSLDAFLQRNQTHTGPDQRLLYGNRALSVAVYGACGFVNVGATAPKAAFYCTPPF